MLDVGALHCISSVFGIWRCNIPLASSFPSKGRNFSLLLPFFLYLGLGEYNAWCNSSNAYLLSYVALETYKWPLYISSPSSSTQYPSYFFSMGFFRNYSLTWRKNSSLTVALEIFILKPVWHVLMASIWTFLLRESTNLFSFPITFLISNSNIGMITISLIGFLNLANQTNTLDLDGQFEAWTFFPLHKTSRPWVHALSLQVPNYGSHKSSHVPLSLKTHNKSHSLPTL